MAVDVSDLPTLNACLNTAAAVLLAAGRSAVKSGRIHAHRRFMLAALAVSACFLTSYLYYHAHAGHTVYDGTGVIRVIYFSVLATHVPLAGLMVPFILAAVILAYLGRTRAHVRIVKWLWPVWMYVSVTGVLIYIMLYILP